jgi:hypothetical protein
MPVKRKDPTNSLHNFYFRYGRGRLVQVLEILNDGQPAAQSRIASVLQVSKSRVSQWIDAWIHWKAEFKPEIAEEFRFLEEFEESSIQHTRERLKEVSKPVQELPEFTPTGISEVLDRETIAVRIPKQKPVVLELSTRKRREA